MVRPCLSVLIGALSAVTTHSRFEGPGVEGPGCGTTVQGGVSGTWTLASSPYCVTGDLAIGTLTIEPGVLVCVSAGVEVSVQGRLDAIGTPQQPIVFAPAEAGAPWAGLVLEATGSGTSLVHVTITGSNGSGLRIDDTVPVLTSCRVVGNTSAGQGGGIFASIASGDLTLEDCEIVGNDAAADGGGLYAVLGAGSLTLNRCEVVGNRANPEAVAVPPFVVAGGGVSVPASEGVFVTDTLIEGNVATATCDECFCGATATGGGLYAADAPVRLTRCVVRENTAVAFDAPGLCSGEIAHADGGGIATRGTRVHLVVDNCVIAGNVVDASANSSLGRGGGIYTLSPLELSNTTVARNRFRSSFGLVYARSAGIETGGGRGTVTNSIVWGNVGSPQVEGVLSVTFSNVQGGFSGNGNLDVVPGFRGPGTLCGDLELAPGSPCIDAGSPDANEDVAFPPSQGTTRNDLGATGGALAAGWKNWARERIELSVSPPASGCGASPTTLTLLTRGGAMTRPVRVFLESIGGVPLPGQGWPVAEARPFCFAGRSTTTVTPDVPPCALRPLVFRSRALDANGMPVSSAPVVW